MSGPVPLKFRNPLLITFLFNFNFIKDGYQKLTYTSFSIPDIRLLCVIFVFYLFAAHCQS